MKKLIVAAMLIAGMASFAQEKPATAETQKKERLTPEQRDAEHLKKMTTDLNLNSSQQKEIGSLLSEQSAKRQKAMADRKAMKDNGQKPTDDERLAMKKQLIDEQIATKAKMKKILTADQYTKWEQMKSEKRDEIKDRMQKRKMKAGTPEEN